MLLCYHRATSCFPSDPLTSDSKAGGRQGLSPRAGLAGMRAWKSGHLRQSQSGSPRHRLDSRNRSVIQYEPDTQSHRPLRDGAAAQDDLTAVAPLLLDADARDAAFAGWRSEKRLAGEAVLQFMAQLAQMTEWQAGQLLEQLGCHVHDLREHRISSERIVRTLEFLRIVSTTTGLVSTVADRRAVVAELAAVANTARLDSRELRDALEAADPPKLASVEYIRLGELSSAGAALRAATGLGPGPEDSAGPFAAVPQVHVSEPRLRAFVEGDQKAFGREVFRHITRHLEDCSACEEAAERVRDGMAALR